MSDLTKFLIKAYARKALAILGTYLMTHHLLTGMLPDEFANAYLDQVVGAVMIGWSAVWTTFYQWYVKRKVVAAKVLPTNTSNDQLEQAAKLTS